jgi:hypothetical protein
MRGRDLGSRPEMLFVRAHILSLEVNQQKKKGCEKRKRSLASQERNESHDEESHASPEKAPSQEPNDKSDDSCRQDEQQNFCEYDYYDDPDDH